MSNKRIIKLADTYLKGKASVEEERELHDWYDRQINDNEEKVVIFTNETEEDIGKRMFIALKAKIEANNKSENSKVVIFRRPFFYIAASVIFLLAFALVFNLIIKSSEQSLPESVITSEYKNDVTPGRQKALLVLSDGKKVTLDGNELEKMIKEGSTEVTNEEGSLIYNNGSTNEEVELLNTLITSRGETYSLILADGTKVWLNSASSIQFPVAFKGKKRTVEIIGEAYFEVAHNANMPFQVKISDMEVQVLGTNFNINGYEDEGGIKTTLLEGSVKVSTKNSSMLIAPGEQTIINNATGKIRLKKDVDVEEALAWKNGKFIFQNANLNEIIKQLEKWYDVTFENQSKSGTEEFVGIISRDVNISQIIKMLEKTGNVKFEIQGKKIIVK